MNHVGSAIPAWNVGALLAGLVPSSAWQARAAEVVTAVCDDSRRISPGAVFVALRGTQSDGRDHVPEALARGAVLVLGEGFSSRGDPRIVDIPDARMLLAQLALRWYGLAADGCGGMKLLGVTGTNGKSTTTFMTRAILRAAGWRCGLLGTVQYELCGRSVAAPMTTPGPLDLAAYLRECADHGAVAAVMEVSSHALDQRRTEGLRFAAAAYTNLSGDHLDYHGTLAAYRGAKARLFEGLAADAVALVNRDDPEHRHMVARTAARVIGYALDAPAEISATISRSTSEGTYYRLRIDGRELVLENALVGRHNVYNALAAAGLAWSVGVPVDAIADGLAALRNVPGRLQRVPCESAADVFVDYAHSDDALRNVLSVLKPLTRGRLIVVFGCGGDRDRTKRPRMARVAAEFADAIYVTSDNPRSEVPTEIIAEILTGFDPAARARVQTDPDRAAAIHAALSLATGGDVVLIAGKGHEDYQIIGSQRIHFDDVEVAIAAAASLSAATTGTERQRA